MDKTIRWGILGCGNIANKFAADIQMVSGSTLRAVAAQDLGRAKNFAKKYKAEKAHRNYTALVNDPDLDVVYVATARSVDPETICISAANLLAIFPHPKMPQRIVLSIIVLRWEKLYLVSYYAVNF
jgi:hypothetical protein